MGLPLPCLSKRTRSIGVIGMVGAALLAPVCAKAEDPSSDPINADYMSQLKTTYAINSTAISSLDWLFVIAGAILSIVSVLYFFYWVIKLLIRLYAIQAGKAQLRDSDFWKRMGVGLLIWLFFMCGAIYSLLESWWIYMKLLGGFK